MHKAISPVIAAVMIIAITLAVGVFIAIWASQLVRTEAEAAVTTTRFECAVVGLAASDAKWANNVLSFNLENTGTADLTINDVRIIYTNVSSAFANRTTTGLPMLLRAGDKLPLAVSNTTDGPPARDIGSVRVLTDCPNANLEIKGEKIDVVQRGIITAIFTDGYENESKVEGKTRIAIYFDGNAKLAIENITPEWSPDNSLVPGDDAGDMASPTLGDLTGDGLLDLLVARESPGVFYGYNNTGTATFPAWTLDPSLEPPDGGDRPAPALGDLTGDGLLDLIIGGGVATWEWYAYWNNGTNTSPVWEGPNDTLKSGLTDYGVATKPTLGDLDGDGDLDMIVGNSVGELYGFSNTGNTTTYWELDSNLTKGLPSDLGGGNEFAAPSLGDLDGDGDMDLIVCGDNGLWKGFRNIGNSTVPNWTSDDSLVANLPSLERYVRCTLGDLDGDLSSPYPNQANGDLELVAGDYVDGSHGNLYGFNNSPQIKYYSNGSFNSTNITTTYPIFKITPTWNSTEPQNTSIVINFSVDGGSTWTQIDNGTDGEWGIASGNKYLKYRPYFYTNNASVTPELHNITIVYYQSV